MTQIRLVIRGDDGGSSISANRALAEAAEYGLLRNISIMAPGPAVQDAARRFAVLSNACLGLHITLNSEWDAPRWGPVLPLSSVPSLVDADGCFWRTPKVAQEAGARVDEMLAEIEAQYETLCRLGIKIGYVDEHMGVSWPWPELRAGIAALASRENLRDAYTVPSLPPPAQASGSLSADLAAQMAAAPSGEYVFITHPAYDDAEMQAFSGLELAPGTIARRRDADRRLLLDQRITEACRFYGIDVIQYTDLP